MKATLVWRRWRWAAPRWEVLATQALAGRCRCKSPNGGKSHQPSSWLASSVTQLDKSNFNPVRRALVLAILHCVTQGWDMDLLSQCFSILYLHQLQWWVFSLGSFPKWDLDGHLRALVCMEHLTVLIMWQSWQAMTWHKHHESCYPGTATGQIYSSTFPTPDNGLHYWKAVWAHSKMGCWWRWCYARMMATLFFLPPFPLLGIFPHYCAASVLSRFRFECCAPVPFNPLHATAVAVPV